MHQPRTPEGATLMPKGVDLVHSDILGLTRDRRGKIGLEAYTCERPNVFRLLAK